MNAARALARATRTGSRLSAAVLHKHNALRREGAGLVDVPFARAFGTGLGVDGAAPSTSRAAAVAAAHPAGNKSVLFRGVKTLTAEPVLDAPAARRSVVLDAVREQALNHRDSFYVVDLQEVARKHREWRSELPRVRPFYAVKCNDDPRIVETLASLGTGFDCASKGEMSMALKLGVKPEDIIFAHPAKQPTHLHYARAKGVTRMTFDNEDELRKIAREHPGAEVVLRILTDDSHSVCRLGLKFGAPLSSVARLVSVAKELNVKCVGISYHVGSGNGNAASFGDAVRDAKTAFDIAAGLGVELKLLDIGGGFPGSEMGAEAGSDHLHGAPLDAANPYSKHPSFSTIAAVVRGALDKHFPAGCGVDIIAEPGRYFVKSSHVLAVNVVGKRLTEDEATRGVRYNYYVNDGLYGSFNCVMYDHVTCSPSLLLAENASETVPLATVATAVADDAIVSMAADGTPVVSDAVGLEHAEVLRGALAPAAPTIDADAAAEALEQLSVKRIVMGGSDETDEFSLSASAGSASVGNAAAAAFIARAAAVASSSASSSSASSGRRSLSYSPLSSAALAVAGASPAPAAEGIKRFPTTLWGPTCDSIDKVTDTALLPELQLGDWLVFENMGAYTIAGSCKFNGFPLSTKVYLNLDGSVDVQKEEEHE